MDGTADVAEPVCYTKKSKPTMDVVLAIVPSVPSGYSASGEVAVVDGVNFRCRKKFTVSGNNVTVPGLIWDEQFELPDAVDNKPYSLNWKVRVDDLPYFDLTNSVNLFICYLWQT